MLLLAGDVIDDRYKIAKYIGKGGMSEVHQAYDNKLKKDVALKILKNIDGESSIGFKRFTREIEVMSRISHPNVVEIQDFFLTDPYIIVMEYIKGQSLKKIIQKRSPMTFSEIIQIMEQIFSAMKEVESHNVVHRDLKPQNIIITATGLLKILDFGISFANTEKKEEGVEKEKIVGSVQYMSPEVVSNKNIDIQSDIYSLGIILYEMIVGNVPFSGNENLDVAIMHVKKRVPSIKLINRDFPDILEAIVRKATSRNKENRYKSFEEFDEQFREFAQLVRSGHLISPGSKPIRKNSGSIFKKLFGKKH